MIMRPFRALASHRIYPGVLLGIATWLLFELLFGGIAQLYKLRPAVVA
jgi:hypothetical protein